MPNVVIVAGPNGAGKSTSALAVIDELMAVGAFVNADMIASGLAAFDSETVAFRAGRIMLERIKELAAQDADFAFETTLASRTFAPFVSRLRATGYSLKLIYIWLESADLCIQRVHARRRAGGHFVDEPTVHRRYERSLKNFFGLYLPLADVWQVYDNSSVAGSRLVAEGYGLTTTIVHQQATWNEMRRRAGA